MKKWAKVEVPMFNYFELVDCSPALALTGNDTLSLLRKPHSGGKS